MTVEQDHRRGRAVYARLLGLLMLAVVLMPLAAFAADADPDDEQAHANALGFIGGVHLSSTLGGLIPDPFTALVMEGIAFSSNISLKWLTPAFIEPPDQAFTPNAPDMCSYDFELPQADHYYSNVFGIELEPVPSDWGALGAPSLFHWGTEVSMGVFNQHIRPNYIVPTTDISFPEGVHRLEWRANTIIDWGFDVALPAAMLYMSYSKFKAAKTAPAAATGAADEVAKEASKFKKAGKWMLEKLGVAVKKGAEQLATTIADDGIEVCSGLIANDCIIVCPDDESDCFMLGGTNFEDRTVSKVYEQFFTVYDVHPPVITYNGTNQPDGAVLPTVTLEAMDFGGVRTSRIRNQLRAPLDSFDPCDRSASLSSDVPEFLRLGTTTLTWTSRDQGPVQGGTVNEVLAYQSIIVEDTQAPIMIPPPGKVIEIDPASAAEIALADVILGVPRVVDLADPTPRVYSDAPATFPLDSRTPVVWSAEDSSGNASMGNQLITVKALGTNTAPRVFDQYATTLTSDPVDIVLQGTDDDLLDGVFDPLSIRLESRPSNGDFVAPLLPYFIEDFRTSPAGPFGQEFVETGNKGNWLYDNICSNPQSPYWYDEDGNQVPINQRIPQDWPYSPKFINVEDNGDYYLIDSYWRCGPSSASTVERISKWTESGELLGYVGYGGSSDTFVQDQDGFLYTLSRNGAGSSTTLFLAQVYSDFEGRRTGSSNIGDSWRFDFNSANNPDTGVSHFISPESLSYARVDSTNHVLYVTDRRRVFVFDVREDFADGIDQNDNTMGDKYLGALKDGEQFLCLNGQHGNSWTGFAIEVDSDGGLYVADTCNNRIHKFGPSTFNAQGEFVMGEYIGWMGRCDSSTNNACDVENQRSRGYTCTDETCYVPDRRTGDDGLNRVGSIGTDPGQFAGPVFMDLDPNDILYVADSGRVQRFAQDGTYGGQAKSTGTGINQGDVPNFILGNMGTVKNVTVNSTHFYVVDQAESFVHVFETTPLKDITDNSATVTYVSNFNFHGGEDSFTYSATDGLAESNVGTVRVQVNRNFRAPYVFDQNVSLDEDTTLAVTLAGDDPDGVIGTDDVFPLDTLTFSVSTPPEHGSLSGSAPDLVYTPDPDFFGEDQFEFIARDGVLNSEPGLVQITVNGVNDQPVIEQLNLPRRVGRGFPTVVSADYKDDGGLQNANAFLTWGDGTTDYNGDFVDPDGPDGAEPPELVGIRINEPPQGVGRGTMMAKHTFTSAGSAPIYTCVATGAAEGPAPCAEAMLQVEELVSLEARISDDPDSTTNNFIDLEIELENAQPEGWAGLSAMNVVMAEVAVAEAGVTQILTQSGECAIGSGGFACSDASMAPGSVISATVRLRRSGTAPLIYDLGVPFALDVATTTPALEEDNTGVRWVTFLADVTDTDGDGMSDVFENTYGLNPNNPADANQDLDGDRLTNLEEYRDTMTNPNLADTDGDGTADNEDFCPVDPGGAVEGTDGLCEADIRSSPVLRIIQLLSEQRR